MSDNDRPIPRLDAPGVLRELNETAGVGLTLEGIAERGESGGAAFVRWPDGRPGVLTYLVPVPWRPDESLEQAREERLSRLALVKEVLELVASKNLPVPSYDLIVPLSGGVALIQSRLPGHPPTEISLPALESMLALNKRFEGLLADRPDVPGPDIVGVGPYPLLEGHGPRGRRMADIIREVVGSTPARSACDLVHPDFNPENLLYNGNDTEITGIVDWHDGVFRGDRGENLVKLRWDIGWGFAVYREGKTRDPDILPRIDHELETTVDPDTLRLLWAHYAHRMIGWSITAYSKADVDFHFDLAEARLT